jgi:hypothetical protein
MTSSLKRSAGPGAARVEAGVALVAIGAALLFVSLFIDWYQPGQSAWHVFEVWDLVLAGLSLVALVAVAGRLRLAPARPDSWLVVPSVAAFVIVFASLVNHPPAAIGKDPMFGIWLALVAAVLMLVGVVPAVARVSVAINIEDGAGSGAGPNATAAKAEREPRRTPLRRSRPVAASAPADAAAGSAQPVGEPATEATRVLEGDPARTSEPKSQE